MEHAVPVLKSLYAESREASRLLSRYLCNARAGGDPQQYVRVMSESRVASTALRYLRWHARSRDVKRAKEAERASSRARLDTRLLASEEQLASEVAVPRHVTLTLSQLRRLDVVDPASRVFRHGYFTCVRCCVVAQWAPLTCPVPAAASPFACTSSGSLKTSSPSASI